MFNTNPKITKRETPKGGSQVLVRGCVWRKSKEWSRFDENIERSSISPKKKFWNSGNHKGRGMIVGWLLKSRKAKISGQQVACVQCIEGVNLH
jgi:hypothetical protein